MYRVVVFNNGGIVNFDRNTTAVPNNIVNELIVKECIENKQLNQPQIRLGRRGEFTARIWREAESGINTAILYPAALQMEGSDSVVHDVTKIYESASDEKDRMNSLVTLRLQQLKIEKIQDDSETTTDVKPTETKEKEKKKNIKKGKDKAKKKRNWNGDDLDSDSEDGLDFSESKSSTNSNKDGIDNGNIQEPLNAGELGENSEHGFVVKELTDELGAILESENDFKEPEQFGFLKKFIGGKKLDDSVLNDVLAAMEDHLVAKNVAKDVAVEICEQVRKDLVGKSTNSWTSVKATVRESVRKTLHKILTPATATDLLASIKRKSATGKPYVISVVGVNGVGKSTNLGKLAFWFLQNDFKVLVAACDTFRSGAVEQLKVHVTRLAKLKGTRGYIELFDQGYGKDAAIIAKRAVEYAEKEKFDVVLIDTAGRRHNDDRLMSNLEKFGNMANPDKIIMVGEALVGTDSVEQARNFDSAFGKSRGLDFFLISKCDTVGEMLGALVNVTYATGVPVLFVGVGQQYTDLRTLSVDWAVDKLLS
ncbi:Signal recognition particle receptor subunit alpha [Starmerella bacillaris]|uniref:Signal recognition particle receptor subunit alpha homolog n=1 Tax=Starmerella bacillaris TaxID=1247836 RepID=A0AAV5RH41_STABA|nr:Signal recognition particle receptor subunit alpha [Starmerella bacillaris]